MTLEPESLLVSRLMQDAGASAPSHESVVCAGKEAEFYVGSLPRDTDRLEGSAASSPFD